MKFRIFVLSFLVVFVFAAFYLRSNTASVYSRIGDFYYKKNNIARAQEFYEKSFLYGNKDYDVREVYINSLINSALTVESQKKIVNIAEDDVQDNAKLTAQYFLYDLSREIHSLYPQNYVRQATFNQKIVRWNRFPITYTYRNSDGIPDYYINEINRAFLEWERTGVVLFSEVEGNADIVISFKNNDKLNTEAGRKYVIAYTVPQIVTETLKGMNIYFCLNNPDGTPFSRNQVYNTALHEIFHALGFMGHSFDRENIMYISKDRKSLLDDDRSKLSQADINTIKLLYKTQPDITNSEELKSEYIPYVVIGNSDNINSSKTREAKNYIHHAPTLPSGYIDLAESLAAQKRYSEAIKNLEKALGLAVTDDVKYIIYYNLGVVYHYANNTAMSLFYIDKAFEINNKEELHFLKAEVLLQADRSEAENEYIYLVKIAPDNSDYVSRLVDYYIKRNKYLKARSVLKPFFMRNPELKNDARFKKYGFLLDLIVL